MRIGEDRIIIQFISNTLFVFSVNKKDEIGGSGYNVIKFLLLVRYEKKDKFVGPKKFPSSWYETR